MSSAREYLEEIDRKRAQIGYLKAELDAMMESINLLPGVSYDGVCVQVSTTDSHVLKMVEECEFRRQQLIREIERYYQDLDARVETIKQLPDQDQARVLILRYVKLWQWSWVQWRMKISESTAYRLHREALEAMEEMLGLEEDYESNEERLDGGGHAARDCGADPVNPGA